jgi:tRNA-2-methylthio-N6-dimethylallyladenosine synthase
MNRGYTREWYLQRIERIRELVPNCGISTDTISGFCTETEEDHKETLSLIETVQYDFAYMFKYSERPGTLAAKKLEDDIEESVKGRRLQEIIDLQMSISEVSNKRDIGKTFQVLVEGPSKKSPEFLQGRNPQNKVIVFPRENFEKGQYVNVLVNGCTSATLRGVAV